MSYVYVDTLQTYSDGQTNRATAWLHSSASEASSKWQLVATRPQQKHHQLDEFMVVIWWLYGGYTVAISSESISDEFICVKLIVVLNH